MPISKNKCPCYKCNDRDIGCHAKCKNYKNWREKYYNTKAEIKKSKVADKMFIEHTIKSLDNFTKARSHAFKNYFDKKSKRGK